MKITNVKAFTIGEKKLIWHPKDQEYFKEYPAPVMEKMHAGHWTNINSTITYFGPMLYFITRALGCEQVLEIGHAEGYTSYYLAHAVKDNAIRFGMKGNMYYGMDIVQTELMREKMAKEGLPATIINMDSIKLTSETFKDITFDLIFQDGAHDTEHVLHEIDVLYPQLKGEGKGYLIFHDCYGPSEDGFKKLQELIKQGKYNLEFVRIFSVYGIAIMRKMDGFDDKKYYWEDHKGLKT